MRRLNIADRDELYRSVLSAYGFKRMTTYVKTVLDSAYSMVGKQQDVAPSTSSPIDEVPTPSYFDEDPKLH